MRKMPVFLNALNIRVVFVLIFSYFTHKTYVVSSLEASEGDASNELTTNVFTENLEKYQHYSVENKFSKVCKQVKEINKLYINRLFRLSL